MIYVAEIKTRAGVYYRFYDVVEETKRLQYVQAMGIRPYKKLSDKEFEIQPNPSDHYGPMLKVSKDTAGLYIEGSGKKGLQKTYLNKVYNPEEKYINIFDAKKVA